MTKKPHIVGIIPARMGSTRFPGKALQKIQGIPMLGHVYFRSKMSTILDDVYLAISGKELEQYADSIGAPWVADRKESYRGCGNAIADAAEAIEVRTGTHIDIVVLIQGDEPMIVPEMINMAVRPLLEDQTVKIVNLMAPIRSDEEHTDPNCPKVVVDRNNNALYFSREPIPSAKKWNGTASRPRWKQVCVIPYEREYLRELSLREPGTLEEVESIDMNRVLEYGEKVRMVPETFETYCVDTPADLERVSRYMERDTLIATYAPRT